jgi:hypothetical protein
VKEGLELVVHIPSGCVAKIKYTVTVTVTVATGAVEKRVLSHALEEAAR